MGGISGVKHKQSLSCRQSWCYPAFTLLNHFSPAKPLHHFKEKAGFVHVWFYFQKESYPKKCQRLKKYLWWQNIHCLLTLNYSREVRKWGRCFIKELPARSVTSSSAGGNNGDIFTLWKHWLCNTFLLQMIGSPASLNTQHAFLRLPSLHYSCCHFFFFLVLFPIAFSVSCLLKTESAASNIRLELSTSWH